MKKHVEIDVSQLGFYTMASDLPSAVVPTEKGQV